MSRDQSCLYLGGTLGTCGQFFIAFVPWELAALVIDILLLSLKSECSSLKGITEETQSSFYKKQKNSQSKYHSSTNKSKLTLVQ